MPQLSAKARTAALVLAAFVGALCLMTTAAVAKSCAGGPSDSAINQYCESIPTSTGGQAGGGHSSHAAGSTLASSLPSRIIHQITGTTAAAATGASTAPGTSTAAGSPTHRRSSATKRPSSGRRTASRHAHKPRVSAAQRRQLLSLPAATVHPTAYRLSAASANVWAPLTWLIAVLAAIALALAGVAFAVSRRRPADR